MPGNRSFMRGAFILAGAAVFIKVLSAVYRVPFQNIVGDVGFYIFQQVYPFYGIAVALSTYGFPVLISKLVAERRQSKQDVQEVIQAAVYVTSAAGGLIFALIFFGADFISREMGDPQLAPLIQISAFSFLLMPFLTVGRGVYQGLGDMVPTAISQVFEQLVRVTFILLLAYVLTVKGYSLYVTGAGALASAVAGGLTAVVILIIYTKKRGFIFFKKERYSMLPRAALVRVLLVQGTAVCLASMLLVLLQLVDSFNLYSGLISAGWSEWQAKAAKGIYDRGQPLLQLGTVAAASLALTLVPLITSKKAAEFKHNVDLVWKLSFTLGIAAATGLINIMEPVNAMLFENSSGSNVLSVFCLSILFSSIFMTFTAILQGKGKDFIPAYAVLVAVLIKYAGNEVFVPLYGTMGAAVATVLAFCFAVLFLGYYIQTKLKVNLLHAAPAAKVLFAAASMTFLLQSWLFIAEKIGISGDDRVQAACIAFSSVGLGATVFTVIMLKLKLFTAEELKQLPFSDKIRKLNNKLN